MGLWVASVLGMRHLSVRIDPVMACNLACQMCYFSSPDYRKNNTGSLKKSEIDDIARVLFSRAFQVVVGCGAEPTMHKHYHALFRLASRYGVPDVSIVTNAQLLKQLDLEIMAETGVSEIVLSVHGVRQDTYEKFMAGARFNKLMEVLEITDQLRQENTYESVPEIRINYTVNAENLEELTGFFNVFGHYHISTLQIRPAMNIGGRYNKVITDDLMARYNEIIRFLNLECRKRGVRFLANTVDAGYKQENSDADIAQLVYTYISPRTASQLEIEWQDCSFREFRKADNWMLRLKNIFLKKGSAHEGLKRSLKYEVL